MIAMIDAGAMQMTVHYVIDMVSVRNGFVSATGTVFMRTFMTGASVVRRAGALVSAGF